MSPSPSIPAGGATPTIRVAHVIHSLGAGGAEHVLVELADVAGAAGLEIVVIGLSPVDEPVHAATLRAKGVTVLQLELARWDPRAILHVATALRRHRIDVVHTHLKHADLVGSIAGRALGRPVVSTLHLIEDAPVGRMATLKRRLGVWGRRLATTTIAVSSAQASWYRELAGRADTVVLPNGVAAPGTLGAEDRATVRRELGAGEGKVLAVTASLMRPEKGHALLLDAVERIPADAGIVFALAGDGPLRAELEARVAATAALRDRVRFLGYRDDVPALLAAADLVVHPSLADALPTTLMHALGVGTPVVATRVGGIADIVTPDTGVLAEPEPAALADAVVALAGDRARRTEMGAAGRLRFERRFSSAVWSAGLRAIYEDALPAR
ncbi:glycosyltransferase [Pseudonocardia ailaonensis]|uniref:Glycosyltransferase n=1 Tax=Pseudonocardia ailaonensis TaxID=367279 RepID=A0ABN2NB31_9PSEU